MAIALVMIIYCSAVLFVLAKALFGSRKEIPHSIAVDLERVRQKRIEELRKRLYAKS